MIKFLKIGVVSAGLAITPAVAFADSVQFDIGNFAIGSKDGYWDRAHTWHAWDKPEYCDTYGLGGGRISSVLHSMRS